MRVLLARLLGYQRPRRPRAINCRHLREDQDGSLHWFETEANTPPNGRVFMPIWYVAHVVTTPDEKMTFAPLSTFCFTYRAAEVQLRRFASIFPTAAVQATTLVFDAADPDHAGGK